MMDDTLARALLIGLTFVAAGFVKGVVGMGLPTLAMGLLGLVMPPAAAAALLIVPSLVTNLWQLLAGPHCGPLLRRLGTMMLAVLLGTGMGIGILTGTSSGMASAALGLILAVYGAVGVAGLRFQVKPQTERGLSPLVGLITGAISGATGIFVIPAVPYLNSLGMKKEELLQALGLSFTVSTIALAGGLALTGTYPAVALETSLLAVFPALAGMFIGQAVRDRMHPDAFRRWFFIALVALGTYMLTRALA